MPVAERMPANPPTRGRRRAGAGSPSTVRCLAHAIGRSVGRLTPNPTRQTALGRSSDQTRVEKGERRGHADRALALALARGDRIGGLAGVPYGLVEPAMGVAMGVEKNAADNFFPIIGIRATLNRERFRQHASSRSSRSRRRKNWRKRDSGSTDRQPLDFPRNGQGKSLEILGKVWKSLEFPWNFLGKIWKSLEKLGAAAIGSSPLNGLSSAGERGPRRAPRRRKIVTQAIENNPSRRKTAPASVGSAVVSAATRCAALGPTRREANPAAPANGRSPPKD